MKKTTLIFIPLIISCIHLTGCKDYKYDSPDGVIRNRKGDVHLVYGYESKASSGDRNMIKDFNNVIVNNLKDAKFTKGRSDVSSENRCVEFTLASNYSSQSIGVANFKLYDNGYITYSYPRYDGKKAVTDTFHYKFNIELAVSVVDQVYEEFDIAKAEEERFLATITLDNFFKMLEKEKCYVAIRSEDRKQRLSYYDNGEALSALKEVDYQTFDFSEKGIDMGYWDIEYCNYPVSYSRGIKYEGGKMYFWRLEIGQATDFRWAVLSFDGEDCYEKNYLVNQAFALDIEQETALVKSIAKICENLKQIAETKD